MSPKQRNILVFAALAVFGVLGLMNFKNSVTPYVTFAEARTMEATVQVAGFPDHQRSRFDSERAAFAFTMTNEAGEAMNVVYPGGKPGNFDQAQSVVVVGRYENGVMEAKQILVKCPSKYEEEGDVHPGDADPGVATESSSE